MDLITNDMKFLVGVGAGLQRATINRRMSVTPQAFQHVKDLQGLIRERTGREFSTQEVFNLIIESHSKIFQGAL